MLITGGTVVDVDGERRSDVRIGADGRIAELAPTLVPSPSEPVHDARGSLVIPGGIDAHTHLDMPFGGT
ncbi:MAG TPA: dihydropyrimidinase, partial [Acidimicrobiia bacterium]|nr:dihydropyrimidinase [Acidimicrobiia bacterium]